MKSNMDFDYSIVIRTLGTTGEKYRTMLDAIEHQTVKPREIVVAIPEGYELDHTLGYERVVRCAKGMVTQRAVGIDEAKGQYLLVLDDDLDFPPDFAEKMYQHLVEHSLDCTLAFPTYPAQTTDTSSPRLSQKQQTRALIKKFRGAFTGQVFYSQRKAEWFDVITSTAGHRTYVNCEDKPCQAGCFQCFFIKGDMAKKVRFTEESWLEQGRLSAYAAYDDAVFFYKLYLQGGRIAYATETGYTHLDAGAGRPAKTKLEAKRIRLYTIGRNRTLFWLLHIWPSRRRLRTLIGGLYALINYTIYNIAINLHPKYWPAIASLFRGYRDAFHYHSNRKKQ